MSIAAYLPRPFSTASYTVPTIPSTLRAILLPSLPTPLSNSDADASELQLSSEDDQPHATSTRAADSLGQPATNDDGGEQLNADTGGDPNGMGENADVAVTSYGVTDSADDDSSGTRTVARLFHGLQEDEDEDDGQQAHRRRRGKRHRRRKGGADELDESEDEKTEERIVAEKVLRVFINKTIGLQEATADPDAPTSTNTTPPVDLISPTSATLTTPLPASALLPVDPSALGDDSPLSSRSNSSGPALLWLLVSLWPRVAACLLQREVPRLCSVLRSLQPVTRDASCYV